MYVDCSQKYKMNQGVMVGGRQPSEEDNLWWKTTFGGRRPLVEDTFGGRWPSVEDNLWWKTTHGGKRPSVEDEFCGSLHAAYSTLRYFLQCCFGS